MRFWIVFLTVLPLLMLGCKGGSEAPKLTLPTHPVQADPASAAAPSAPGEAKAKAADDPTAASMIEGAAPTAASESASSGTVRATGSTAPHRSSAVAVNGSGLLEKMLVQEGDFIQAGQVIARLDRSDSELRVRQGQVALEGAKVGLAAAQRERNRLARLDQGAAVSQAQIDQAQTALEGAKSCVAAAEVGLAMAVDANRNRTVRAPYAGLVVARLKAEGEWITTMPPSPVIMLAEVSPLDLQIDAPEYLLNRIRVGDRVVARFSSIGRTIETTVTRIVPIIQTGNRSFKIYSELANKDLAIQPGVFAEVEITPGLNQLADKADKKVRRSRTGQ